jgi:hypothetical protein
MTSLLALLLLSPQDLFERDRSLQRRLSPGIEHKEIKPHRAGVELDVAPDFACGNFDLKASFKTLFDKNVREEFLGSALSAVKSELAGSALVLACYASPTVCDAIKHYRVSANAMLGMELDTCRAVEQSLDGVQRRSQARAIKECLDEKARQGATLDEAQRACRQAGQVRGLDGKAVKEIDLQRDLGVSDALVPPLKLGAGTLRAEARGTAVVEAFEAKRRDATAAWEGALGNPSKASLEKLGPVGRVEVERIAAMDPARRDVVVRSVASASALAELVKEAHETERALESAELLAEPEVRVELERRRMQLRNEIGRLVERFELERRVNAAVDAAQSAAAADAAGKARERLAPGRAREAERSMQEETKPWGCEVKPDSRDSRKGDGHDAKR